MTSMWAVGWIRGPWLTGSRRLLRTLNQLKQKLSTFPFHWSGERDGRGGGGCGDGGSRGEEEEDWEEKIRKAPLNKNILLTAFTLTLSEILSFFSLSLSLSLYLSISLSLFNSLSSISLYVYIIKSLEKIQKLWTIYSIVNLQQSDVFSWNSKISNNILIWFDIIC